MVRSTWKWLWALMCCVAVAGCLGGETGDPGADETGAGCIDTVTVLPSATADSPLGFTAADALAHAEGTFVDSLHWIAADGVVYGPESGPSTITTTVAYEGGEVRFVDSEIDPAALVGIDCPDRIEVDVAVTVSSSGGALAETFTAPLRAVDERHASIIQSIEPASLGGSLTASDDGGLTFAGVSIEAGFSDAGRHGEVIAFFEGESGGVSSVARAEIARWPSSAGCEDPTAIAVGLADRFFSFSGNDALTLASSTMDVPATWRDGTTTTVALGVTAASDVACVRTGTASDGDRLSLRGNLRIVSADGRVDGVLPIGVTATPGADGTLASVALSPPVVGRGVAPADLAATYGLSGVDASMYDEALVEAEASFDPGTVAPTTYGRLTVLGLTVPDCVENPTPGGGCQGIERTELDWIEW